jgi:hypothetical protein
MFHVTRGRNVSRILAVDLSVLDPSLVDPDEDMVAEKFPEMVSVEPPTRAMSNGEEEPGQIGALARWAETTADFDRSDVTVRSLQEGRMAYRGVIPPHALSEIEIPSVSIAAFVLAMPDDLRALLPQSPPPFGGWRNEVERSRTLVATMATGVLDAVAQVQIRVEDPAEVPLICHQLIRMSAELARSGKLVEAEAVADARRAIEPLETLFGFPLSDLDTAQDAARAAGSLAHALGTLPGVDFDYQSSRVSAAFKAAAWIPSGG